MSIFTVSSNQVQFTTEAVSASDTFIGGIRFAPDGKVRASTDAAAVYNGGVPQTGTGQVCVVDATAGLPAGTVFVNAIPVSAGNKVCCSTGAAASYNNGTPYAANGAICATGLASFPLDGITTPTMAISTARRLTTSYTGHLLNVINAAGTPANIGYTGSNVLDTAALLAHTGTGGSDTGRIVRVNGQVGTLDAYQGTAANSPWIVQAGAIHTIGGKPGCKPQTVTAGVNTVTIATTTSANLHPAQGDFTYVLVSITPTATTERDFYRNTGAGGGGVQLYSSIFTDYVRYDVAEAVMQTANNSNTPGSSVRVYAGRRSGSACEFWRNQEVAALGTATNSTTMAANVYSIFTGPTNRTYAEFYWWNSALPDAEFNAIRANCTTFYGATYP